MQVQLTAQGTLMKKLVKTCLAAALLGFASAALASPTIELKDGSRIVGDIQGIENGVYTVLSPNLGTVHVAQSNIVRIVYGGNVSNAAVSPGKSPAPDNAMTQNIQQLQAQLAQDPSAMQQIMSLQNDPQIQAVLNDPSIANAIQDGDFMSLIGNPKVQALESNPHLQQLLQQQGH